LSKESFRFQASHWFIGVVSKELCIFIAAKTQVLSILRSIRGHIQYARRVCIQMIDNKLSSSLFLCATRLSKGKELLRFKSGPLRVATFRALFGHDSTSQGLYAFLCSRLTTLLDLRCRDKKQAVKSASEVFPRRAVCTVCSGDLPRLLAIKGQVYLQHIHQLTTHLLRPQAIYRLFQLSQSHKHIKRIFQ